MAQLSPLFAPRFVATKSGEEIVRRLREDESLINAGKACSWVAWHLPNYNHDQGKVIAFHLAPFPELSHEIKQTIYENLLNNIRRCLQRGDFNYASSGDAKETEHDQVLPKPLELVTALKVIAHLQETAAIRKSTPAESIVTLLKKRLDISTNITPNLSTTSIIPKPPLISQKRLLTRHIHLCVCHVAHSIMHPPRFRCHQNLPYPWALSLSSPAHDLI
jgi:hypothetical protein